MRGVPGQRIMQPVPSRTLNMTAAHAPLRVLLIDDDDSVAGSLRQYLTLQGCDVRVAVDEVSARAAMRSEAYDAIVVDPYLTGAIHGATDAFFSSIGELQPAASTIVLTGYPSPELSRAAAECRLTTVLAKPQSVVTIGQLVSELPSLSSKGLPE